MSIAWGMANLGLSRMDAAWYTPAVTMCRLRMAWHENNGQEQHWGASRLDAAFEEMTNGQQG